jgi:3-oxoacyl-[acyl-carrier protein] reductase/(S)-1-phenylethanol dehydrogenase
MNHDNARVALITGAAGGLGQVFALRLAQAGLRLVITDRSPCTALAARLRESGAEFFDLSCELSDGAAVQRLASQALEHAGRVDVLVNSAAIIPNADIAGTSSELLRQVMAINVEAPFLLARALAPQMVERAWGRVVNFSSSSVWSPLPGMAPYVISKMGVIGMTRAMAAEWGGGGITVNAISPGLTRHEGSTAAQPEFVFEAVRRRQFIPRSEVPDDLAGVLAFLVSDEARFITGQVLNVDGGGFGF